MKSFTPITSLLRCLVLTLRNIRWQEILWRNPSIQSKGEYLSLSSCRTIVIISEGYAATRNSKNVVACRLLKVCVKMRLPSVSEGTLPLGTHKCTNSRYRSPKLYSAQAVHSLLLKNRWDVGSRASSGVVECRIYWLLKRFVSDSLYLKVRHRV